MYVNKILTKEPKGFIALMSAVVISAILITATIMGSLTGFYTRFNILDSEFKNRSSALADSCVDELLFRIANSQTIAGTIVLGSDQCQILNSSSPYKIRAVYQNSYTNIQVAVDATPAITSWQETAN